MLVVLLSFSEFTSRSCKALEIPHGIHLIRIPTPFAVGPVNCYLIEGSPLTLIDTGVKSALSLEVLKDGVSEAGYDIADIEQVCITHGHVDHMGLAETISEHSNHDVDIWIHEQDLVRLTDYENYIEDRMKAYHRIAEESGAPVTNGVLNSERQMADYFLKYGESAKSAKALTDSQQIRTGMGTLETVWTPGHSLGSVCYVMKGERVLFAGDHVLGDISSNPSLDFDGKLGISMLTYFNSLERVRRYADYLVLPGHRSLVENLEERIDFLLSDYDRKLNEVETALSHNPISVYELSRRIYGDYSSDQLVLAVAETQDLVRILAESEKAVLAHKDGVLLVSSSG